MAEYEVHNNETDMQFEVLLSEKKAYLSYRFYKKDIALMHTFVPAEFEGKGIASTLAKAAFNYAQTHNKQVIVFCPFVASFIQKHTEYKAQLDPEHGRAAGNEAS